MRDGKPAPAHLALYAAAATLLFLFERLLPNPVPWVRLGLANMVTLYVLLRHGAGAALWVLALRLCLGGFFAGTLLGPQFWLGAGGGAVSWLVMLAAARVGGAWLSPLGISVLGASAHALTQLGMVAALFAAGSGVWALLPLFLGIGIVTGAFTGVVVDVLLARLERVPPGAA